MAGYSMENPECDFTCHLPVSKRTAGNPDKLWNISIVIETVVDDVSVHSCQLVDTCDSVVTAGEE